MAEQEKIYVGFIAYGKSTAKYLPYFLPSLKNQMGVSFKILAVDNSKTREEENALYLKSSYPEIEFRQPGENLGFAKAFNLMIKQAIADGADYFLALNPDMILEPDMLKELLKTANQDKKIAAVQPKILKWDFDLNAKISLIDSAGLSITKEHRFSDSRQGERDNLAGEAYEIFGFTGAAVLLNLIALKDVAYKDKEYFDELMFMYKEDCDLSYRLRLAGWKIYLSPKAVAYHDRAVSPKGETNLKIALNRLNKSRQIKRWSFLNHWILLLKLKNLPFSFCVRLATIWYQFKSLIFVALVEPYLLSEFLNLWRLRNEIKDKRRQTKIKVGLNEIEQFMV